jgi:kynurenine formamidase
MTKRLAAAAALAASALCLLAAAQGRTKAARPLDLATCRVVDLSHPFDDKTIYWPTSPTKFELKQLSFGPTPGGWFYASNSICTPEHGGTHLDAPIHFGEGRQTADQIPVRKLIAPAMLIDVSARAAKDVDYRLTVDDVVGWEKRHGRISRGAIAVLRTGWGKRWPDRKSYMGDDTPNDASKLHFPSYGAEAAELLVKERGVNGLGVDTASIDPGASTDFPVHRLAAAADVFGLENLANLEQVPETGAWIAALPMKIAGGSGGPLRAVALIDQPRPRAAVGSTGNQSLGGTQPGVVSREDGYR